MDLAIEILERQFEWVENNRELCPHDDKYYEGYKEGTSSCLSLLMSANQQIRKVLKEK